MVSPGGQESAFCDPPQRMSIFALRTSTGLPNMPETESTTVRMPYSFRIGQRVWMSLSMPLGVSQCTRVAYLKALSFLRKARSGSAAMGACESTVYSTGSPP